MTTVLDSLNTALHNAFAADDRVILLGEDVLDPYGGAFKVTRGLSSAYPERVLTTPISEAGIVGVATGMALRGLRPVVEIMFGDFITLIADQVINHLTKFRWMYNEQVRVPLVIRTPMGGRRGYGPTHSQTLEKIFLGVPGLRVLAPSALGEPGALLEHAILDDEDPVLFVENKLLYLRQVVDSHGHGDFVISIIHPSPDTKQGGLDSIGYAPTFHLRINSAPRPSLTIAAYGYMAELARQAAVQLAYEKEIFVELVVPTQLSPFELQPLFDSTDSTGRLLIVEEGTLSMGWGAEVLSRVVQAIGPDLKNIRRLAALDLPVPASAPIESSVLPGVADIVKTVAEMV